MCSPTSGSAATRSRCSPTRWTVGRADAGVGAQFNLSDTTFVLLCRSSQHGAGAHLHPGPGIAVCRPPQHRHRLRARPHGVGSARDDDLRGGRRSGRGDIAGAPMARPAAPSSRRPTRCRSATGCAPNLADCVELRSVRRADGRAFSAGRGGRVGFIIAELTDRERGPRPADPLRRSCEAAEQFPDLADHFAVHLYVRDPTTRPSFHPHVPPARRHRRGPGDGQRQRGPRGVAGLAGAR